MFRIYSDALTLRTPSEAVFWEYKELRERDFGVSDPVRLKIPSPPPEKYPNRKGRKSEWEVEKLWEWEEKGGLGTTSLQYWA